MQIKNLYKRLNICDCYFQTKEYLADPSKFAAVSAAPVAAADAPAKKAEAKVESEEESDDDMGFGLFD